MDGGVAFAYPFLIPRLLRMQRRGKTLVEMRHCGEDVKRDTRRITFSLAAPKCRKSRDCLRGLLLVATNGGGPSEQTETRTFGPADLRPGRERAFEGRKRMLGRTGDM